MDHYHQGRVTKVKYCRTSIVAIASEETVPFGTYLVLRIQVGKRVAVPRHLVRQVTTGVVTTSVASLGPNPGSIHVLETRLVFVCVIA